MTTNQLRLKEITTEIRKLQVILLIKMFCELVKPFIINVKIVIEF